MTLLRPSGFAGQADNLHNLPWQGANIFAYDAAENVVVTAYGRDGDDARDKIKMIVRAVNTHAALVEALEIAELHLEAGAARDEVRATLAAAKEPSK